MNATYEKFTAQCRKIALLNSSAGVLGWDQEVYMPEKGSELKAAQVSLISGMVHELFTDPAFVDLTIALGEDRTLNEEQRVNVTQVRRTLDKSLRLSKEFVETLSSEISGAFGAWHKAKHENRYEIFAPHLEKLIALKREQAELLGYSVHPYNALVDEFEPGATVAEMDVLFNDVRKQLVAFVQKIAAKPRPDDGFMLQHYPAEDQKKMGRMLAETMGYDFSAGRMDLAPHPFCIGLHPGDVRITHRLNPGDLSEIIWGMTHEAGHALYEQGLLPGNFGLPMGSAVSLAIHESQSRLWENNVSRSLPYWRHFFPRLQELFPAQLGNVSAESFYKAANIVEPSLIRTSADELNYHFHVMIRYEIEKAIMEGRLTVNDLPAYWNAKYKEYLGIDVPDDARGILQDVHWSHGSFGYFPTYSLGSFYAAQLYNAAEKQVPHLEKKIAAGELLPLREWLRSSVHEHGMRYSAQELCEKVTGEKLNFRYFMEYATKKYTAIYELS